MSLLQVQSKKIILVPSIAGSMLPKEPITIKIEPINHEQLNQIASEAEVINYIRHPATVQLLQKLLPNMKQASSPEYKINPSDIIVMVSLSQRAPASGAEVNVNSFDQLVIYLITVTV